MSRVAFELPLALYLGLPATLLLLAVAASRGRPRLPARQALSLAVLRGLALALLCVLLARPVVVESADQEARTGVAVLLDHSESMGLVEGGQSRYARALALARDVVLPAVRETDLDPQGVLFADDARSAGPESWAGATADGDRTDLAGAIAHAIVGASPPPLAIVALTDGIANTSTSNRAALASLLDSGAPFIGIGIGGDRGVASLSLRRLEAPPAVAPRQEFQIQAMLQTTGDGEEMQPFELQLLRDGRFAQRRTVRPGTGSRFWGESFRVVEDAEGMHEYAVQVVGRSRPGVVTVNRTASVRIRVVREREFRILFVQGTLTWDFKFVGRALRGDPSVRLTGLSRTSQHSIFRQNVETAGELLAGFPATMAEIAPFRVVVLSDLMPADLTADQQDLLARFVAERGGGVLMLGGPSTFDATWQGSRLEQLLPVTFDPAPGVSGLDQPFQLRLTEDALRSPVFRVADAGTREVWASLPTFTQYGRVRSAKPGATAWAVHASDQGPDGPRILMASQPYGAGQSAVVCVQSFWRWRLAKDADPLQFDRFWQQFLRYLGQAGGQDVVIELADQELVTGADIRAVLQRQPQPGRKAAPGRDRYRVLVSDPAGNTLLEQSVELSPLHPVGISFRAEHTGLHTIAVHDASDTLVSTRAVEIPDASRELLRTGRDLESLRQWAELSGGVSLPAEEWDPPTLGARLAEALDRARNASDRRRPVGVNGWMLAAIGACLAAEWALRRRFALT